MKPIGTHNYFVYIITNFSKSVLYTGVTNDLHYRLKQHYEASKFGARTFAGKYHCHFLLYYERFDFIEHAIEREKQIKGWSRAKKEKLITQFNSEWNFLNEDVEPF